MHAGPGASRTLGFLPTGRAWGAPLDAKMATLYYSMRLDDPRVAACWVPPWLGLGLGLGFALPCFISQGKGVARSQLA